MQYYIALASSLHTVRSIDMINTLIVDNVLKHTLLMSIECDYCHMQPRIITLFYITIIIRRVAYLFPLGLLHTHKMSLEECWNDLFSITPPYGVRTPCCPY